MPDTLTATNMMTEDERLKKYYEFIFPYKELFQWLSYYQISKSRRPLAQSEGKNTEDAQESEYFFKREFSFTLKNDIYCRYLSFKSPQSLHETLIEKVPHKIDIGAVFNLPPKNHNSAEKSVFTPQEKEMVLDIDMTDYDDVRTCCEGAAVCEKCWKFMAVAVDIIDKALKEDFGFDDMLWVFSGRRGIHCWICDDFGRGMKGEVRASIMDYLSVNLGNEMNSNRVSLPDKIHPALKRAFSIIGNRFKEIVIED